MNTQLIVLVASMSAALAGAISGYFVVARRLSGKIATSDAASLWAASEKMREHLTTRLDVAYDRASVLESRIEALEAESAAAKREHHDQVRALEGRVDRLEQENAELRAENNGLKVRIRELEAHVPGVEEVLE